MVKKAQDQISSSPKPPVPPDSRYGRRILHAVRRIIRSADLYSRKLAVEHEVTGPQLVCLNTIVELGPITATDLAHQVHLSASTVVRILDRLENKGLILRERQKDDRRRVHLTATITGHELSAKAPYSEQHPLRAALKQLPLQEQDAVTSLLEQLVELMDAASLSAAPVLEVGSIQGTGQASDVLSTPDSADESDQTLNDN
jgi:DNA-binding MarR family transcriptional regulator